MPSSGNPTWADGPAGGTAITAASLNNLEAMGVASVAKAGDTVTGTVKLSSAAGVQIGLNLQTNGVDRIKFRKSNETESGGNAGGNLEIIRCDDTGAEIDVVAKIYRTGVADFPDGINTGGTPAGTANNVQVPNTQWVNAAWKSALALPLTATYYYRTGGTTSTAATANGFAYAMVFVAGRTCNINRLAVNVATAGSAGAVIRLALVEVTNPDTKAWTLVTDLGTVAATTTGVKELTGTIPVTLGKIYAVLAISQGGASTQPVMTFLSPNAGNGFGCTTNTSAITNGVPAFSVSGITGAVGASGTGAETSVSWACAVRADT